MRAIIPKSWEYQKTFRRSYQGLTKSSRYWEPVSAREIPGASGDYLQRAVQRGVEFGEEPNEQLWGTWMQFKDVDSDECCLIQSQPHPR